MAQQKFLKDLLWLQLLNWLIKPFWILVLENTVQNRLGESLYGSYFVVFNFSLLFTILMDMGMNSLLTRALAAGRPPLNLWSAALPLKLVLSVVYASFTLLIGYHYELIWPVVLNQILLQWILFFRAFLQGSGKARTDAWFSVSDRVIALVFCLVLIQGSWFAGAKVLLWFVLSQTAGYAITLFLIARKVKRTLLLPSGVSSEGKEGPLNMPQMLRSSLGFALLALLMVGFTRIDAIMLQMLRTDGVFQAGIYARGFRLLDAGLIFPILMSTVLLPAFTGKSAGSRELSRLVETGALVMLLVAIPVSLIGFTYAGPIMDLLNPGAEGRNGQGVMVLAWLMTAYLPMSLVYVFGTLLTALNRLSLLNMLALGALLVNIVGNLLLVPQHGALGAAWSAGITQLCFCSGCIWFARRELKFGHLQVYGKIVMLTAVCAFFAWILHQIGASWYMQVAGALFLWVIPVVIGKLHPDFHIREFLSKRNPEG